MRDLGHARCLAVKHAKLRDQRTKLLTEQRASNAGNRLLR